MINLETPTRMRAYVNQAHQVAAEFLRPSSRRYDLAEHEYPKELDMLASMVDGMHESGTSQGAGPGTAPGTWPERPIRFIVGYPAGGPSDTFGGFGARQWQVGLIADGLAKALPDPATEV